MCLYCEQVRRLSGRAFPRCRFDHGEALNSPPPHFHDVNVVVTFHYMKCIARIILRVHLVSIMLAAMDYRLHVYVCLCVSMSSR